VCLLEDGNVLANEVADAPMQASAALVKMIDAIGPGGVDVYVADTGPGSFIGVRVAVTLAKSLAWASGRLCSGVSAFDLIAPDALVAFPSKRGEYFVRSATGVELSKQVPEGATGFGPDFETPAYPDLRNLRYLWDRIQPTEPALLLPEYIIEPSISTPKTPYATQ